MPHHRAFLVVGFIGSAEHRDPLAARQCAELAHSTGSVPVQPQQFRALRIRMVILRWEGHHRVQCTCTCESDDRCCATTLLRHERATPTLKIPGVGMQCSRSAASTTARTDTETALVVASWTTQPWQIYEPGTAGWKSLSWKRDPLSMTRSPACIF